MTTTPEAEFLLCMAPDGLVNVAWRTHEALAERFGVGVPAISRHLGNIFASAELAHDAVVSTTASGGPAALGVSP